MSCSRPTTTAVADVSLHENNPKTEVSSSSSNPPFTPITSLSKYQCPLAQTCPLVSSGQQQQKHCPFGHQPTHVNLQPLPRLLCVDHFLLTFNGGKCPNHEVRQARGLVRCAAGYHPSVEDIADAGRLKAYLIRLPPVTPKGPTAGSLMMVREEGGDGSEQDDTVMGISLTSLIAGPRRTPADEDIEEGAVSTTETSDGDFRVERQRKNISRRYPRGHRDQQRYRRFLRDHQDWCRWWTVQEHQIFVRGFVNGCLITLLVILGAVSLYLGYQAIFYGRGRKRG